MSKKIIIILTIIITLILVLSLIYTTFMAPQPSNITVNQLYDEGIMGDFDLSVGKVYNIKDEVEKICIFILPAMSDNYSVDINNLSTYSAVFFKSDPTLPLFFMGDRSSDFSKGKEVELNLEVREYRIPFSGSHFDITNLETAFVYYMILEFQSAIYIGKFSIISFNLDKINDKTFRLNVTDVVNLNSLSICWSDVYVDFSDRDKPQPSFKVFSSNNLFIGEFRERNMSMISEEVEIGQYLKFEFDKNSYGNLTLIFGGDILPSYSNSHEPFFFDEFPISRVDI